MFIEHVKSAFYREPPSVAYIQIPDMVYVDWSFRRNVTTPVIEAYSGGWYQTMDFPIPTEAYGRGTLYCRDERIAVTLAELAKPWWRPNDNPEDVDKFPELAVYYYVNTPNGGGVRLRRIRFRRVVFCTFPDGDAAVMKTLSEKIEKAEEVAALQQITFALMMRSDEAFAEGLNPAIIDEYVE